MNTLHRELVRILIDEEIEHIVAQARRGSGLLRTGDHADRLLHQYPNCGMDGRALTDELIAAASKAGIAVEIGRPAEVSQSAAA